MTGTCATRAHYRARRDALARALVEHLPQAQVLGIAAGLHLVVELPPHIDETALAEAARRRDVGVYALRDYRVDATATNTGASPALVLGYAALTEASIAEGVRLLAAAIRDTAPA